VPVWVGCGCGERHWFGEGCRFGRDTGLGDAGWGGTWFWGAMRGFGERCGLLGGIQVFGEGCRFLGRDAGFGEQCGFWGGMWFLVRDAGFWEG